MTPRPALLALALLTSTATAALAQVDVHDHRTDQDRAAEPPAWDSTGWVSLGERTVRGRADHDTIAVGAGQGRFSKLTFVVEGSDLAMFDIVVRFGNGETFSPTTRLVFDAGSRTRAIDLPGDDRIITAIDFKYGNLRKRGKAKVHAWGLAVADVDVVDHRDHHEPPPPEAAWSPSGWTLLGTRTVDGKRDRDTLKIGRYKGRIDQLTFVVEDADVEVTKITIWFEKGKKWSPDVRHAFAAGSRTRVLDLPGADRHIKKIELRYRNLADGHRATVSVYGRDTREGVDPGVTVRDHREGDDGGRDHDRDHRHDEPAFDSTGWTLLGEQTVDGRRDHDQIDVPKASSRLTKLTLVVLDSDLELADVRVTYQRGRAKSLAVKHSFREGQRTRAIDLPKGKRVRTIELDYGNTAGGGAAKVQVWGQ